MVVRYYERVYYSHICNRPKGKWNKKENKETYRRVSMVKKKGN
jgi:hypothetical protein